MRTTFYQALATDLAFSTLIPGERILEASVISVPETPTPSIADGMWAVITQNALDPGLVHTSAVQGRGQLYIYDSPGSYLRIDNAHRVARDLFERVIPFTVGDEVLAGADWEGVSDDRFDDQYNAIYRVASWRLTGRVRSTP
jgi:hypothetical protein